MLQILSGEVEYSVWSSRYVTKDDLWEAVFLQAFLQLRYVFAVKY